MMKYYDRLYSKAEQKMICELFDMTIERILDNELKIIVMDLKEYFIVNQKLYRIIINSVEYIKKYCIDDEAYINLSNKEKSIVDLLSVIQNEMENNVSRETMKGGD